MNRNQRRYGRVTPRRDGIEDRIRGKNVESTKKDELQEILSPRNKRNPFKNDKAVANRCCSIKPSQKDQQHQRKQSANNFVDDHFNSLIKQQYDFDPAIPDTINHLRDLRSIPCGSTTKVENYSQYVSPDSKLKSPSYVEMSDGSQWQNVDNARDLETLLKAEKEEVCKTKAFDSKNIYIGEVPHVKVIAEKFSKFKRNNVELRKLEEKIVCVEYDVFEDNCLNDSLPIQKMRAYFSVKPINITDDEDTLTFMPSTIKNRFYIIEEDLGKLNEKEIEMIDGKISENKPYLDDLKRVLRRKQAIYAKKKKSSLDLKSLYEMAKRELPSLDEDFSNTNLLSKAELDEIKELITKKCVSSVHGISRRTFKCEKEDATNRNDKINVISESIFAELIRNDTCI